MTRTGGPSHPTASGLGARGPGPVKSGLITYSVLQVSGLRLPPSLAAPGPGVLTHLLLLPASKQPKRDTCRRTGSGSSRLARSLESRSWLGIRVPRPKARPWRGALSWERDTGRLHGSCSDQTRPDSEALPGTRSRRLDSQPTRPSRQSRSPDGTRSRGHGDSAVSQSTHSAEPTVTLSGPAGQANRSAAVRRRDTEPGKRGLGGLPAPPLG